MDDAIAQGTTRSAAEHVRVWAYSATTRQLRDSVPLAEVSDLLTDPTTLVWVDLEAAPTALLHLQEECRLHPLAVEDAQTRHQRPKIDEYDHFYFVVFYVPQATSRSATEEVSLFLGERFLVTVHQAPIPEIDTTVRHWHTNAAELGPNIGALLYSLLDNFVDAYFPIIDRIGEEVDELQERLFERTDRQVLQHLARLRRDLLTIRRVLAPEREVINALIRRDQPILPLLAIPYFHDIYDHVVRLTEMIDTQRDLLATAVDVYVSLTSNNLNEVMKTLTGWSIILMSIAVITGIYGMNFRMMPELESPLGYPLALVGMLVVSIGLFSYFRRRDWL